MNSEVTAMERQRTSEDIDESPIERSESPPMDFDAWVDDNFALTKEGDDFTSFANDVEAIHAHLHYTGPSGFVLDKATALDGVQSNLDKISAHPQSREEVRFPPLLQDEQKLTGGATGAKFKGTVHKKKNSSYIRLSRRKKKPKGMPKRPLSAYNLYFQAERAKILSKQEEGKPRIGFEGLGKIIGKQWRDLSSVEKKKYAKLAEKDSERYRKEMDVYQEMKAKRLAEEDRKAGEETPVLSKLTSSRVSSPNFMKEQTSLRTIPVREVVGSSAILPHPPESMVSAVAALPPGATSVSYRPIRVEQAPSAPLYGIVQSNSFSDPRYPAIRTDPSSQYLPQHPITLASEPPSYDTAAPKKGEATRSPNCPMPPGMEVVLADRNGIDRKYSVQYTCYSMTRENANKYIDSITKRAGNSRNNASSIPWPQPPPPTTASNLEYGESWRV